MKSLIVILMGLFFCNLQANAGFVAEPSVGVQGMTGTTAFSYKYNTTQYNYYQQSIPVGLALSYKMSSGLLIGVMGEYYANGYLTAQTTNQFGQDTFTRTIGRAIIGFESQHGLRMFVGYDIMNNISNTPATNNTNDFTALNNNGYAVGLGWRIKSHLAINAIYDIPSASPTSITPKNSGTTGTFTSSTYNSFGTAGIWNINISFPFGTDLK